MRPLQVPHLILDPFQLLLLILSFLLCLFQLRLHLLGLLHLDGHPGLCGLLSHPPSQRLHLGLLVLPLEPLNLELHLGLLEAHIEALLRDHRILLDDLLVQVGQRLVLLPRLLLLPQVLQVHLVHEVKLVLELDPQFHLVLVRFDVPQEFFLGTSPLQRLILDQVLKVTHLLSLLLLEVGQMQVKVVDLFAQREELLVLHGHSLPKILGILHDKKLVIG